MSPTEPDAGTRQAEDSDAARPHTADRQPTPGEEEAAEQEVSAESDEERRRVAAHYSEMADLGAEAKGEGRIE
ncbi:MAG: hypothetical protein ABSC41_07125 [Acidimicrobiales bacterium]|jgi:hypothetical protein